MSDVKWIKITTDIFDDDKILLIEGLPDADALIVIWFKLLCLAGKQNNSGVFLLNDRTPYTDKMLATIFRRKESTVQLALRTFEEFGMIELVDGVITIPNWAKHQSLDQLENRKEYMRGYMKDYRKKQKLLAAGKESKVYGKSNSKSNVNSLEEEVEEDKIREDKIREESTLSSDKVCRTKYVRRIVDEWNSLGLAQLRKIDSTSTRGTMTRKRVMDYGIDTVIEAIQRVDKSSFLKGQNPKGWVITYDWFIKPNNFTKVLEGNYDSRGGSGHKTFMDV